MMHRPERRPATVPVLIICLGGGSIVEPSPFTAELCEHLTASGATVITFDFYGMGQTGGNPNEWTYGRLAANLSDICDYVSAQEWADQSRIGALGVSAGSTAMLRYAIETRKLAAGIAVATYLGHFASMPDGPAKLLVDHLDALIAGGDYRGEGARFGRLPRRSTGSTNLPVRSSSSKVVPITSIGDLTHDWATS
jgi:dienelactone hydrolase